MSFQLKLKNKFIFVSKYMMGFKIHDSNGLMIQNGLMTCYNVEEAKPKRWKHSKDQIYISYSNQNAKDDPSPRVQRMCSVQG